MNAKTETKTTMYKWTACNPYNYLNGVVEAYPALNGHVLIVRMSIYCITSRHVIIAFVPRMPCMEKQPTMPGSRLENGKFHNKRA